MILGQALEKATGESMADLLQEKVLDPLGLDNTKPNLTAEIPEPVLHAFTGERGPFLNVPADQPFYEESTCWNPSWTINHGAIQTSNIADLHDSRRRGRHRRVAVARVVQGDDHDRPTRQDVQRRRLSDVPAVGDDQTYGLGVWVIGTGDWIFQNPLFCGYAAVNAYLPSKKIAIAVTTTWASEAWAPDSPAIQNGSDVLWRKIGAVLATPDNAPPQTTAALKALVF